MSIVIKHCCTGIKPGNAACTAGPRSQAAVNLQVAVIYVPGIWLHMAPLFTVDIRKFHDTVLLWPSKVDVFWLSWSFSVGCTLCFGHLPQLPLFGRNLPSLSSLKYWYVGIPWPLTPLKSWPVWTFHDFFWLATKICYSYVVASSSLRISAWRKASIHCQHNPWHGLEDPCDTRLRDSCRGLWMEVASGNACCIGNCGHSNLWKFLDHLVIAKVATDQSPWYPGVKMLSSWCNRIFIRPRLWKILEHHRFSMVFTHPEFAIHALPESFGLAEVEPTQYSSALDHWRIVTIRAYLWPV